MTEPTPAELNGLLGDLELLDGLFSLAQRAETEHEMKIWVTKNNHAWASEVTGLSLEEIERRYAQARADKVVCSITVRESHG